MKKIILSILIALACKLSIGQKLVQTYYDWNKIHPKEVYYVNTAGQKSGAYKLYDASGVVVKEYNFLSGAENGLCIDYAVTANNQRVVAAKGSFINGQPDGSYVRYCDEDGYKNKVQEGRYKNGKKTGAWKEWWCTKIYDKIYVNILKSIGSYKDGGYDGAWTFYYETGNLDKRGAYKDGKEEGTWNFYDSDDSTKILYTGKFVAGQKAGKWRIYLNKDFKETEDRTQWVAYKNIDFDSDVRNDTSFVIYYLTGEKYAEGHMMRGRGPFGNPMWQKGGSYTEYYKTGKIKTTGFYDSDKRSGDWKSNYENGVLYQEGSYGRDDRENGKWNTYYESGKLKSVKTYSGGYSPPSEIQYDEQGKITKQTGGGGDD